MNEKAGFQFDGFKISRSLIEIKGKGSQELTVEIIPRAVLNNLENTFVLEMNVSIVDDSGNIKIEIMLEGLFKIVERNENLNSFLFTNAPAIMFPYIRAYISSLTALSGATTITLPTLNLSGLKEKIAENFEEIN